MFIAISPDDNQFYNLLQGFKKFGWYPNECTSADLPELTKYADILREKVINDLIDARTLLTDMDPEILDGRNFGSAGMVAHAIVNIMERVMTCGRLGNGAEMVIQALENNHSDESPGDAS